MTATTTGHGSADIGQLEAMAPLIAAEADDALRRTLAAAQAEMAIVQLRAAIANWFKGAALPTMQVVPGTQALIRIRNGGTLIMTADEAQRLCIQLWMTAAAEARNREALLC
ncbi:hypothetical protein ACFU99_11160 [Streptomyces sp. NPDC057654]|uniref:hypothetical protein n=1 Tax=Streptomyces sp. NPDC057654 TaxID=3346196 RepID=UPI003683D82D